METIWMYDGDGCYFGGGELKPRPKYEELNDAAEAIATVRDLPAVKRHPELDGPLRAAEAWSREMYRTVKEKER